MAGDIALPEDLAGSALARTLRECREAGWVEVHQVPPGFKKVCITAAGRALVDKA